MPSIEVNGIETRIDAHYSSLKIEPRFSEHRISTRLPTPLATRQNSADELARPPTTSNDLLAGLGGQVRASSPDKA
jgi:hypothetical protein